MSKNKLIIEMAIFTAFLFVSFSCIIINQKGKEYLRLDSWGSNDGLTKYYENMNFVNVKTGKKGVYKYKLWEKKVKK